MSVTKQQAHLSRLIDRVEAAKRDHASLDVLLAACADAIESATASDAMFLSGADPHSKQFAALTHVRNLPDQMLAPFMANEFRQDDVNKFAFLADHGIIARTLHDATSNRPDLSIRFRNVYRPHGFGPELRAIITDGRTHWGFLTLLREAGAKDFTREEIATSEWLCRTLAVALRHFHTLGLTPAPVLTQPGTITLDAGGEVLSISDRAGEALKHMCDAPIHAVASSAIARAQGRVGPPPIARLRTATGPWLIARGDAVRDGDGNPIHASVVLEPATSPHVASILTRAFGLTDREQTIFSHLTRGETTSEMARALFISPHTVHDHVKSILRKTGCNSRAELVYRYFGGDG